jgi:hypothetical protein
MTDSGNQKLANCFTFSTRALQMKVMAVVRSRAGQVRHRNRIQRRGLG